MDVFHPADTLRELEQQLAAIDLPMRRLREVNDFEATSAIPDYDLGLLAALGAAHSRLMDQRERLSPCSHEREES